MQWDNPIGWILIINSILVGVMISFLWSRRRAPGARAFIVMLLGMIVWSFTYGMEMFQLTLEGKLFWSRLTYIGITIVPNAWFALALDYSGRSSWLNRWTLSWMALHPITVMVLTYTNAAHQWMLVGLHLIDRWGLVLMEVSGYGPAFWVHAFISYVLLLVGAFLLVWSVVRAPGVYRSQVATILVAAVAPWISNIVLLTAGLPFDPTPLAFTVTAAALGFSVVRFRLFNLAPVARDRLVETMEEAVLVLDNQGRLVDANPAVLTLLRGQDSRTIPVNLAGRTAEWLFATWRESLKPYFSASERSGEVNLGSPASPHWYEVSVTTVQTEGRHPLDEYHSKDEHSTARLVVFHDIQDRKKAEADIAVARDQAVQASLLKSQLLSRISHELNTPLANVLSESELLLAGGHGPLSQGQADLVQEVFLSAQQMDLFLRDLLDRSMIEKGSLALANAPFQLTELAASVHSLATLSASEQAVELSFQIDPHLPATLTGDFKRLQQVLSSLVNHVIQQAYGKPVYIRLGCHDQGWQMQVSNSPNPTEVLPHRYSPPDPQAENQADNHPGLSIAYYLVTLMGGYIELGPNLQRMSTLRVVLPLP